MQKPSSSAMGRDPPAVRTCAESKMFHLRFETSLQTSRNRAKIDRFFGHILLDCGHCSVICGGQSIHYRSAVLD
jgi:hypothetical protein